MLRNPAGGGRACCITAGTRGRPRVARPSRMGGGTRVSRAPASGTLYGVNIGISVLSARAVSAVGAESQLDTVNAPHFRPGANRPDSPRNTRSDGVGLNSLVLEQASWQRHQWRLTKLECEPIDQIGIGWLNRRPPRDNFAQAGHRVWLANHRAASQPTTAKHLQPDGTPEYGRRSLARGRLSIDLVARNNVSQDVGAAPEARSRPVG